MACFDRKLLRVIFWAFASLRMSGIEALSRWKWHWKMTTINSPTVKEVLEQECQQVETSRSLRLGSNDSRPAARYSLIGLAFSGGGIRSATFNLGILQALAHETLLRAFDYISTVSGGGYIGGWLMGWMHHQQVGIQTVEERLSEPPDPPKQSADPPEVHFVRDYSNYLTPRKEC